MNKPIVERGIKIHRSQLENNDYNPNKTTQRQQEAIKESLKNYGQLTAILVRPHPDDSDRYIIIDGEHRGQVLQEEVYVDVVRNLSEADAKKLTIIMNETRGNADKIELAQLLADLSSSFGEDLKLGLPYDDTELSELLQLAEVDWDDFSSNFDEDDEDDKDKDEDEEYQTVTMELDKNAFALFTSAKDLIAKNEVLSSIEGIANGQVLECLASEYLKNKNERE